MKHQVPSALFHLILVDDDDRRFSIAGPFVNDTRVHRRLDAACAAGRALRCLEIAKETSDRAQLIAELTLRTGYTYTTDVFRRTPAVS